MSAGKVLAFILTSVFCLPLSALAQGAPTSADQPSSPRLTVIVGDPATNTPNTSVIIIPPETTWRGPISLGPRQADPSSTADLQAWARSQSAANGLMSPTLQPWHVVISYDQFDQDGDNTHSGTIEEFWASPKKYVISYKSDNLHQADYATGHGLFRSGDQRWPNRSEMQARNEIVDPFHYAASLDGFSLENIERNFGTHSMHCVSLARAQGGISAPTQYCFDQGDAALRYTRGYGWFQTVYNDIVSFQGGHVARNVEVTEGGKAYLKLRVLTIERISSIDEAAFVPPSDAVNLQNQRLSGVIPKALQQPFPEWPASLRGQQFSVTVDIVVGRDGRVLSAHAVSGPPEAYKSAEKSAMRWTFHPYLVLDQPAEVETRIILSQN